METITIPTELLEHVKSGYSCYKESVHNELQKQMAKATTDEEKLAIDKQLNLLSKITLQKWALELVSNQATRLLANRQTEVLAKVLNADEPKIADA